jgi:hypothetical protein
MPKLMETEHAAVKCETCKRYIILKNNVPPDDDLNPLRIGMGDLSGNSYQYECDCGAVHDYSQTDIVKITIEDGAPVI